MIHFRLQTCSGSALIISLLLCRCSMVVSLRILSKTQCDSDKQHAPAPLDIYLKRCKIEYRPTHRQSVSFIKPALSCIEHQATRAFVFSVLSQLSNNTYLIYSTCGCPLFPDILESNIWINKPLATKWTFFFNFWPRMPDHLVGREHHEGSHLLHRELLVRQPGNGPCVGKVSTAL